MPTIQEAEILQREQYTALRTMLDALILNAQKAVIDNDIKDDIKTDP